MKKVIICIHGLGNKPPKYLLQKWWKAAIREGLINIGISKKLPPFELVYWADILYEKPLNNRIKNVENPYFLNEPYKRASKKAPIENHSFRQKVIDFVTEQLNNIFLNEDKTLNYTFITDAILRKYFRDLEIYYTDECKDENDITCRSRDLIRNRVVECIKKYKNHDIMIIAHSMGSIITFDVLSFLIPEVEIHTLVTIGSPLGLPIVVSKIADEQKKKINGKSIMTTPPGITSNWFNFADIMDHVAMSYRLANDFSENENDIHPTDFLVNNNYEIKGEKNPHKSFGYLRTPEFSRILSDFIEGKKLNSGQKALGKAHEIFDKIKKQSQVLKDKLNLK